MEDLSSTKWYFLLLLPTDVSNMKYFAFGVANAGKTGAGGGRLAGKTESPTYLLGLIFHPVFSISQSHSWLSAPPEFNVFTAVLGGNANSANI